MVAIGADSYGRQRCLFLSWLVSGADYYGCPRRASLWCVSSWPPAVRILMVASAAPFYVSQWWAPLGRQWLRIPIVASGSPALLVRGALPLSRQLCAFLWSTAMRLSMLVIGGLL
jgi:hypothetical protein